MISAARRTQYARGFVALGILDEAEAELAAIPFEDASLPDVLAAYAEFNLAVKRWAPMVGFASRLTEVQPSNLQGWVWWAYALRQLNLVGAARNVLLQIEATHGRNDAVIPYNLACYYCILGEIPTARRYFTKACAMDPSLEGSVYTEPDLKWIREEVAP